MTRAQTVSPPQALRWLEAGEAVLVDVREPEEFRAGHIAHALSVPLAAVGDTFGHMPFPAHRRIVIQCQKGARGAAACATLAGMNLPNAVYNLEGGLVAWQQAGLPVVAAGIAAPRFPGLFRQVQIVVGLMVLAATAAGLSGWTAGFYLAAAIGGMLAFAGFSGWCGMAMVLARAPWNR